MTEKAKRLAPAGETLRRLFLTSGNLCAFPGCCRLMMDENGVFIGQICHIEAAEEGGQRFNKSSDNEQRRSFENLLLMCYEHHKVTDNEEKYPVNRLKEIKATHEARFSDPQRAMLEKLTDWTDFNSPTLVNNLLRLDKVLDWGFSAGELKQSCAELNEYIERFRVVPIELRRFLGAVTRRSWKMRNSKVVQESGGTAILASDIERALSLSDFDVASKLSALESYGLMSLEQIETSFRSEAALRIDDLKSGWNVWPDIVEFCERESIGLETFTEDLNFAQLDAP